MSNKMAIDFLNQLPLIIFVMGGICCIPFIAGRQWLRLTLVVVSIIAGIVFWYGYLRNAIFAKINIASPVNKKALPEPKPAPVSEVSSSPIDGSIFTNILLVLGAIALLCLIAWGALELLNRYAEKRLAANRGAFLIESIVNQASEKLEKVMLDSGSYETDLAKQIDYPLMADVTQEPVSKYVEYMRLAISAKDSLPTTPTFETAQHYLTVVTKFEVSFQAAEAWAKRVKWSTFSVDEVQRLKDAKVSLALIEDLTTSPDQRNALYKRLEKLLTGLVNITEPVKLTLSAKVPMFSLESTKV